MKYIYALDKIPSDKLDKVGGKAMSLSLMLQNLKVNVPYGYVLTSDAIENNHLRPEAKSEITNLMSLLDPAKTYAVRSSAINEDSVDASFAGQYETITNVKVSDIEKAINDVISSADTGRVKTYSDSFNEDNLGIAIVIQEFIVATFSGVIFTSDVITGSDSFMLGNYVAGEGENLVSGAKNAETFKLHTVKFKYEGSNELKMFSKTLYRYSKAIKEFYKMPMDIEWAIKDKKVYILQSRPITTLKRLDEKTYKINGSLSNLKLLTRTNVGEIFLKPVSPMTFSALEKINAFLGIPEWLDNIYGQAFMNISVMCSLLVGFGMKEEKAFVKIKDLVGNVPEGIKVPVSPFDRKAFMANLKKLIFPKEKSKLSSLEKHNMVTNLANISRELIDEIRKINTNKDLLTYWDTKLIPMLKDGLASILFECGTQMIPLFSTRNKITKIAGEDMANRLCGGCVGVLDSMKPLLLIEEIISGNLQKDEYVKICGHRCANEMELMEPRPYEDPMFPDNVISAHKNSKISIKAMQATQAKEFSIALTEFKTKYPSKSNWIDKEIEKFRYANQFREDIRSKGVWIFSVFREFILKTGEINNLGNDVFMFMIDELFDYLKGDLKSTDILTKRKETYEYYLTFETFPSLILGRFIPEEWQADPNKRKDFFCSWDLGYNEVSNDASIKGFAGAAGVVEGKVKVISDISRIDEIQSGDILVTSATNIGWTLVFPKVKAIVTDIGAPLSHAAIVAREFGIPAVVGCGNATTVLKTGDMVRIDGSKGTVEILK